MPMNPAHRLIQLGVKSLGFDPGPVDGWYGPDTHLACTALAAQGPITATPWAVRTLNRGLAGLGYMEGPHGDRFDAATRSALGMMLDAGGLPAASVVTSAQPVTPTKPAMQPVQTRSVMRQGSTNKVIDTFMLHCAAVPGDWHLYKSNAEIVAAIHRMHTLPKSQGGRGWSDTGYHSITCPDGERFDARPWQRSGAGALGYNTGVYHQLMIEVDTITRTRRAEDYFTPDTLATTKRHIEEISQRTPITRLMGHREVAAKLCPGFDVIDAEWTDRVVS